MISIKVKNKKKVLEKNLLVSQRWLDQAISKLSLEKIKMPKIGLIELFFVNEKEIQRLNKLYRGINKKTDVLSFGFNEENSFPGENIVGQIFICPKIARKQALEHQVTVKEEIQFLVVHALLHVFGFDHEKKADFKKMFEIQLKLFPQIKWLDYVQLIYHEAFEREAS